MAKLSTRRKGISKSQPIASLQKLLANKRSDLAWHYKVGKQVLKLVPPNDREYGQDRMMELVRQVFGSQDPNKGLYFSQFLYATRTFAILYVPKELASLKELSWTHVRCLLTVAEKKTRARLQRRCSHERWNVRELRLAILDEQGRTSKGGRPRRSEENLGPIAVLLETVRLSQEWLRSCPVWFDRNKNKLAAIAEQDTEVALLEQTVAELQKLEGSARQLHLTIEALRGRPKAARRGRR